MNTIISFDTLTYAKKLIAAGFTQQQAEVQAEAIREIIEERLATKHDLMELEKNMRQEIKETELHLKYELTFRFGVMLAAAVIILAAIIKLS